MITDVQQCDWRRLRVYSAEVAARVQLYTTNCRAPAFRRASLVASPKMVYKWVLQSIAEYKWVRKDYSVAWTCEKKNIPDSNRK